MNWPMLTVTTQSVYKEIICNYNNIFPFLIILPTIAQQSVELYVIKLHGIGVNITFFHIFITNFKGEKIACSVPSGFDVMDESMYMRLTQAGTDYGIRSISVCNVLQIYDTADLKVRGAFKF